MSNSKFNKSKSGIESGIEVTLNLSPNVIGDANDESNFSYKLLLTTLQVSRLCKDFGNGPSANIKFSKTQLSKMVQSGGSLSELFGFNSLKIADSLTTPFALCREKDVPKSKKDLQNFIVDTRVDDFLSKKN